MNNCTIPAKRVDLNRIQFHLLNAADRPLQEALRHTAKMRGKIGEEYVCPSGFRLIGQDSVALEVSANGLRTGGGGIHQDATRLQQTGQ